MDTNSNRNNLIIGGLLVAMGLLFLVGMLFQQALDGLDWDSLWPFIIIAVGGLFFAGMFLGGRSASGLAIPGCIITTVGGILLFQNTFMYFESWAYAWALIVAAVGVGLVMHGKYSGQEGAVRSGLNTLKIGLVLFLVFGAMMEFIYSTVGVSDGPAALLFALGLALGSGYELVRRVLRQMRRGASGRGDDQDDGNPGLFWPVILLGLGLLWSLVALGVLPGEQVLVMLRLWPVLLVAVGLELIFGRRRAWVSAGLGILVVVGMFAFVTLGGALRLSERAPWLYAGVALNGGFGTETVVGNGQVTSEERPVRSFTGIDLRGQGSVELVQGDQESLVVEAEENLLPYIVTRVSGGELIIETKDGANLSATQPIRYRITVKDLNAITISGSGDVALPDLQTGDLDLHINGSGSIHLDDLQADALIAKINGSGDIEVAGTTGSLDININGSGDFRGADLTAQQVEVDIPGSGEVVVWAVDDLDVSISGSGSVSYYGAPQIRQSGRQGKVNSLGNK